jgi:hypothetical protein
MTPQATLLHVWLRRQLSSDARDWLEQSRESLARSPTDRNLFLAIGLVPRRIGKADLLLSGEDLQAAHDARPGWNPIGWSADQAARLLLLSSIADDPERFALQLEQLFRTADVGELVTLYRGLPLYPAPERHLARAREGARSNMKAVFEAVAHDNPYPAEQFAEDAWNQMVVKAVFIGSSLDRIADLDRRRNPELARMLRDYAHERRAAHRAISPELWRCVGAFADAGTLNELQQVLATGSDFERRCAALALADSPTQAAHRFLATVPTLADAIRRGELTWASAAESGS